MAKIIWTKSYKLNHQKGFFKIFISSHDTNFYYGAVLYYEKTGSWSEGNDVHLEMKLEQFIDTSEESVYQQCINWIDRNLEGKYDVELITSL